MQAADFLVQAVKAGIDTRQAVRVLVGVFDILNCCSEREGEGLGPAFGLAKL